MERIVDLNHHLNQTALVGAAPDVELRPLFDAQHQELPRFRSVTRVDTGEALSVVSDRYTLVKHNDLLEGADAAIERLGLKEVPRGIYFQNRGARLRALYKFPQLAQRVDERDEICPLIRFTNSYDATNRISVEIGAFRFVCTNFAIGGGGVFAAGFASLHIGEIDTASIGKRLEEFLGGFGEITETYRRWSQQPYTAAEAETIRKAIEPIGKVHTKGVAVAATTLFDAYNHLTRYATHETRTANVAFRLLDTVNRTFQGFSAN